MTKGEVVIVEEIPKNFQKDFKEWKTAQREALEACREWLHKPESDQACAGSQIAIAREVKLRHEFWVRVRERYGHWRHKLMIGEGYSLISLGVKKPRG